MVNGLADFRWWRYITNRKCFGCWYGKIQRTGKLGDVMMESISAAETYIRSRAPELGVLPGCIKRDIHIHALEGATPKDGPSAGIAMVTAMVSVLTDNPIRKDVNDWRSNLAVKSCNRWLKENYWLQSCGY